MFSCFNHTIFDMQVLTHELGHAFAGYMAMRSQPISDYYSETTDIAEIHSMSMEQFAYPYAQWFFGDQADKFRFAHLLRRSPADAQGADVPVAPAGGEVHALAQVRQ